MKHLREIADKYPDVKDATSWKRTGRAMGSNPGGIFKDHEGTEHYVKHSPSDDHAHNEILGNRMYEHLGVNTLKPELIKHSKGLGVASKMVHLTHMKLDDHNDVKDIQKHFGAHAFLSNWDTVGLEHDNQARHNGKMTTVDAGGSLNYRAMGGPKGKLFGHTVPEFHSLRDENMNEQSHSVFGHMKPHEIVDSIKPVSNFKNKDIHSLVHAHGPGTFEDKEDITNKLVARKRDLVSKANSLARQHNLPHLKDIDE